MIKHYLTVALRNLLKYRVQNLISILGLAAGFLFFTLSTLWLRYEKTYDTEYPGGDRLYIIGREQGATATYNQEKISFQSVQEDKYYAKLNNFPEVEAHTVFTQMDGIEIDTAFVNLFNLQLIDGSWDFLHDKVDEVAVSENYAKTHFPNENPLGKAFPKNPKKTIGAIVSNMGAHTMFHSNWFSQYKEQKRYRGWIICYNILRLKEGTDVASFNKKLQQVDSCMCAYPLREYRHLQHNSPASMKMDHLRIFSFSSALLILCALVNFMMLFHIRLKSRSREMALRIVNGSSGRRLVLLFCTESFVIMLLALFLGLLVIEWVQTDFTRLAQIVQPKGYVLQQSIGYMAVVSVLSLFVCLFPILSVKRQVLQQSIVRPNHSYLTLRKTGIVVQLTISLCFIFCTMMMMKQIAFLKSADYGFNYRNHAYIHCGNIEKGNSNADSRESVYQELIEKLSALPAVEHMLPFGENDIFNRSMTVSSVIYPMTEDKEVFYTFIYGIMDLSNPFYGLQLVEGRLPSKDTWQENEVVITENLRYTLGYAPAVGQQIRLSQGVDTEVRTIVGVIKDLYTSPANLEPLPYLFTGKGQTDQVKKNFRSISFSYRPGQEEEVRQEVKKVMDTKNYDYVLNFANELFEKELKSENNLLMLLRIISGVCILISIFGVYSIVSLACNQRRKEIALRKINGATLRDILKIFLKEYGLLLLIAATIAFSMGYYAMHQWLQQYLYRTTIDWWVYAVVLVGMAAVLVMSVGYRVLKTARENPAKVLKSE